MVSNDCFDYVLLTCILIYDTHHFEIQEISENIQNYKKNANNKNGLPT